MTELSFDGRPWLRVEEPEVHQLFPQLGGYVLGFRVPLRSLEGAAGQAPVTFYGFGGVMHATGAGRASRVGRVTAGDAVIQVLPRGAHDPDLLHLEIEVTRDALHALEEVRGGGALEFRTSLSVLATAGAFPPKRASYDLRIPCPREKWLDLLRTAKVTDSVLIEIPFPLGPDAPKAAVQWLRTAESHFREGRYRDAVAACRDVIESLTTSNDDKSDMHAAFSAVAKGDPAARAHGLAERLLVVRKAIQNVTHMAKHPGRDDDERECSWDREDARLVLGLTAALLRWYARSA